MTLSTFLFTVGGAEEKAVHFKHLFSYFEFMTS